MMRQLRYGFTQDHVNKYKAVIPPSEPVEDFDDRNALYAMRDSIINAGLHEHQAHLREE
jgi:protein-ribulosamine 3-kinase